MKHDGVSVFLVICYAKQLVVKRCRISFTNTICALCTSSKWKILLGGSNGDGMPEVLSNDGYGCCFGFFVVVFCHSFLMLAVSGCQPFFLLHCGGGFVERGY